MWHTATSLFYVHRRGAVAYVLRHARMVAAQYSPSRSTTTAVPKRGSKGSGAAFNMIWVSSYRESTGLWPSASEQVVC